MKKMTYIMLCMTLLLLSACDVHEWPEPPEYAKLHLRLNYETDMAEWNHTYDEDKEVVTELGMGKTYDNHQKYGKIRYIVRAYPTSEKQRAEQGKVQEFTFTKDISEGYDHRVTLDVLPGSYNIMVWSDLVETSNDAYFYDAEDFAEIMLQGTHRANTDHRDAFRGTNSISLMTDMKERQPDTLDIVMQRPLAKYEFVTNDVAEFIDKESTRVNSKSATNEDAPTRAVKLEDYKVVFYYIGFMPHAYSIYTDKPVDSSTGIIFESTLKELNDSEASMGFDYIFTNGTESAVTVQIGIFDQEDTRISLTAPIEVPIRRSHHTILKGRFLMTEASGGVYVNPEYDGDHNVIFP